jgi:hypothetical protein
MVTPTLFEGKAGLKSRKTGMHPKKKGRTRNAGQRQDGRVAGQESCGTGELRDGV